VIFFIAFIESSSNKCPEVSCKIYGTCNFVVQLDHPKKNYKFGFGLTVGE
jgi:hypothetical protein